MKRRSARVRSQRRQCRNVNWRLRDIWRLPTVGPPTTHQPVPVVPFQLTETESCPNGYSTPANMTTSPAYCRPLIGHLAPSILQFNPVSPAVRHSASYWLELDYNYNPSSLLLKNWDKKNILSWRAHHFCRTLIRGISFVEWRQSKTFIRIQILASNKKI